MIELPQVEANEALADYIKRLIDNNVITATQIPAVIKHYNNK